MNAVASLVRLMVCQLRRVVRCGSTRLTCVGILIQSGLQNIRLRGRSRTCMHSLIFRFQVAFASFLLVDCRSFGWLGLVPRREGVAPFGDGRGTRCFAAR
jgi:hypothetical protein